MVQPQIESQAMSFPGKTETKSIVGGLIWLLAIAGLIILFNSNLRNSSIFARMKSYFGNQSRAIELFSSDYQRIGVADPIFLQADGETVRVGNITHIDFGPGYEGYKLGDNKTAQVTLFGNAPPLAPGDYVVVHQAGNSAEWVVRTMMPPKTRQKIIGLMTEAWTQNEEELVKLFTPLIEDSVADFGRIVKEDLQTAIEKHGEEIEELTSRYRDQLVNREILPLISDEIWPIVREESQPLAEEIGREIWQEVSVWRFGWRYLYDKSPLPQKKLAEKEFNRFVEKSAGPILESHLEDFIKVQESLLSKISSNEKVKQTFSKTATVISNDPKFRELVATIFQEVLVENERLAESLKETWKSPKAQQAMDHASQRFDPVVTDIGATLFGSTSTAITPEFARVLRNKVLHKDERWLTLHTQASGNRDEKLANMIVERIENGKMNSETGRTRLPMITSLVVEDFPIAAAPEIEEVVRQKVAEKRDSPE